MRWVIATDDFPPHDGGVAIWAATVARGLADGGDEVTVLARGRPDLVRDGPYRVIGVPGPSFSRRGGLWAALAALGVRRPDRFLAATWPLATALVGPLGRGVPVDVVFHGSDLTRPARTERAFQRVCRAADRRWCVSAYLRDVLAARGHASVVLPAPVDASDRVAKPGAGDRWVMIGRATRLKGGDRFVRLVAAAGATGTVYGDGPERAAWEGLARELGADVRFMGHVPHQALRQALSAFDVAFLVPRADADGSGAEGLGLGLIEAALAGIATVGCRTGGVPEAVGAGLILEDVDDVEGSVREIQGWWSAERGAVCRADAMSRHGTARTIAALQG